MVPPRARVSATFDYQNSTQQTPAGAKMHRLELLRTLTLGSSVAEFDEDLARYFLQTNTFDRLVEDKIDIVAGDKGSGKTALYRYLSDNAASIPQLSKVTVLPGFNPSGAPVFQRLTQSAALTEGQYATVWKAYFLSLAGNWCLPFFDGSGSQDAKKLDQLLRQLDLRMTDDEPVSTFSRVAAWAKRMFSPRSLGIEFKVDASGLPVVTPTAFYSSNGDEEAEEVQLTSHKEALGVLDAMLKDLDCVVWIVLDRLDEAFLGHPEVELRALRALFRAYLDLRAFGSLRLKIFIRRDLFSRLSQGGFVNLTHANAKKGEIIWDDDDLHALLCRRLKGSALFLEGLKNSGLSDFSDRGIYDAVFPPHVEPFQKSQNTWQWLLSKTRDGNRCIQPRNLIDMVIFAQDEQMRREQISPSTKVIPVLGPEAIKRAFTRLSKQRVEDSILAEASKEIAVCVEALRYGKAEHNGKSLSTAFGIEEAHLQPFVRVLMDLRFLEELKGTYKVSILYREGLNIRLGKAFAPKRLARSSSRMRKRE